MKLLSLRLRQFRSHHDTRIGELRRLNLFTGLNNAGKSSILDALSMLLTGTCRGAWNGRELGELRTQGGGQRSRDRWQVSAVLEIAGAQHKLGRREDQGPRSAMGDAIRELVKIDPRAIRACLYAGELLRMKRADAQTMLLDLVGGVAKLPDRVPELLEQIGSTLDLEGVDLDVATVDGIYKDLYQQRTEERRALNRGTPAKPEPPEEFKADLEGLDLDQLSGAIGHLERAKGTIVARRQALDKPRLDTMGAGMRRARLEQQLVKIDERAKAIGSVKAKLRHTVQQINQGTKFNEERQQKVEEAAGVIGPLEAEIAALERSREAIKKPPPHLGDGSKVTCPTCRRGFTASSHKKCLDGLQAAIEGKRRAHAEAVEKYGKLSDPVDVGELERKRARLEADDERLEQLAKDRKRVEAELVELTEPEESADEDAAGDEEKAQLDERINEAQRRLEIVKRYQAQLLLHVEATAQLEGQEARVGVLEELVELFGPRGPVRANLGSKVGEFCRDVEALIEPLGFGGVDLQPLLDQRDDPYINGRPARMLSESEQLRFSTAFAVALAKHTGLELVAVDGWDHLQGQAREQTQEILRQSGLQVLLFATLTKQEPDTFLQMAARANADGSVTSYYYVDYVEGRSAVLRPVEERRVG